MTIHTLPIRQSADMTAALATKRLCDSLQALVDLPQDTKAMLSVESLKGMADVINDVAEQVRLLEIIRLSRAAEQGK